MENNSVTAPEAESMTLWLSASVFPVISENKNDSAIIIPNTYDNVTASKKSSNSALTIDKITAIW